MGLAWRDEQYKQIIYNLGYPPRCWRSGLQMLIIIAALLCLIILSHFLYYRGGKQLLLSFLLTVATFVAYLTYMMKTM